MNKFISAVLILLAVAVPGKPMAENTPTFPGVRDVYISARDGKMELDDASGIVEAFLKAHPRHPVATVFLGSIKARMAKEAFFPFKKLAYVNIGVDLLDDAVARLDEAEIGDGYDGRVDILMVSGLTNANIPTVFGRRQFAERDLRRVIELPGFGRVPAQSKAQAYAWLAVFSSPRDKAAANNLLAKARAEDRAAADAIWEKES